MNLSRPVLAFLCAFALALPAAAADAPKPFDLRDSLSPAQFHAAGLDKLSAAELSDLNAVAARYAGTPAFDLSDVMTVRQYHAAGLDKLSPDEISALNAAVSKGTSAPASVAPSAPAPTPAAPAPVAVPTPAVAMTAPAAPVPAASTTPAPVAPTTSAFGEEMLHTEPSADSPLNMTTSLPGRFRGWNGNTVFKFANGQVWVQSGPGMFDVDLQSPTVIIKRLKFGYLLTVPGQVQTVFIRRIH